MNARSMNAVPSIIFVQNQKRKNKVLQKQYLSKAFIHTKDQSPRDSQDDKIFPKHCYVLVYCVLLAFCLFC